MYAEEPVALAVPHSLCVLGSLLGSSTVTVTVTEDTAHDLEAIVL
jgi:hypothetical protein